MNKFINWILLGILFILLINLVRSWLSFQTRGSIIKEAQERLQKGLDTQSELNRELAKVESQAYIEKEARNKLNLGKEGEYILLLPSISPLITPTPTPLDTLPKWQKWVNLFLK